MEIAGKYSSITVCILHSIICICPKDTLHNKTNGKGWFCFLEIQYIKPFCNSHCLSIDYLFFQYMYIDHANQDLNFTWPAEHFWKYCLEKQTGISSYWKHFTLAHYETIKRLQSKTSNPKYKCPPNFHWPLDDTSGNILEPNSKIHLFETLNSPIILAIAVPLTHRQTSQRTRAS